MILILLKYTVSKWERVGNAFAANNQTEPSKTENSSQEHIKKINSFLLYNINKSVMPCYHNQYRVTMLCASYIWSVAASAKDKEHK